MRVVTTVSAVGLAAGLALTGAHMASASPRSAGAQSAGAQSAGAQSAGVQQAAARTDITLPSGGVLEQRVTKFCGRVPKLIERAGKAETRLDAGADTKGSLAWLKAREAKATANHHPRVAKRIERRIERRTDRLKKLPDLKTRLASADKECATLDLPTPTPSTTSS